MSPRAHIWLSALATCFALSACGEKPQGLTGGKQQDAAPHMGTGKAYAEKGWKQGDVKSWESHLRARAQNGQNEYVRTP